MPGAPRRRGTTTKKSLDPPGSRGHGLVSRSYSSESMASMRSTNSSKSPSTARKMAGLLTAILFISGVLLLGYQKKDGERAMLSSVLDHSLDMLTSSTSSSECRYYLAESAIPHGGLGLFTALPIPKGELAQSMLDICVYIIDSPHRRTQLETHSWAADVFNGVWEGHRARALCEGFATLFNAMPPGVATSKLTSHRVNTHAGLTRDKHPGAGAITQFYGIGSEAIREVPAGSEMTIDYGDFPYEPDKVYEPPIRDVDWLHENGMCIDNIRIGPSTIPEAGRGAFASRTLRKGQIISPAPIETYVREAFVSDHVESVLVNYCFQPKDSSIMLFPYGPGVNLINHGGGGSPSQKPNVHLKWSTNPYHHGAFLNMELAEYIDVTRPGSIILDVVASRDIAPGDELLLDYGPEWEAAWLKHVQTWKPVPNAQSYVYPQDIDNTLPLATWEERQKQDADILKTGSLINVCWTDNWERTSGSTLKWTRPTTYDWPEGLVVCHILERHEHAGSEEDTYTVALHFSSRIRDYDPSQPNYIDTDVPRSAISWVEPPYTSDMYLPQVFRHPIALPEHLSPELWMDKTS